GRIVHTLSLAPPQDPGFGQLPTSLALSNDEKTLYVACGGANAVAVVALQPGAPSKARVAGYIPTGWFPIALTAHTGQLCVACSKGIGPRILSPRNHSYGVHNSIGTLQFLPDVARLDLHALSQIVAVNN